jgi:hypothetical protein
MTKNSQSGTQWLKRKWIKIGGFLVGLATIVATIVAVAELRHVVKESKSNASDSATRIAILDKQLDVQREAATLQAQAFSASSGPTETAIAEKKAQLDSTAEALNREKREIGDERKPIAASDKQSPSEPTLTPTATDTPVPTSTPVPPSPTSTNTPIPPSPTPTLSPTPSPTPTPSVILPFEDNFDPGPRSEWRPQYGKWGMAGKKYTLLDVTNSPVVGMTWVGDSSWRNYVVEAEISGLHDPRIVVATYVYCKDYYDTESLNPGSACYGPTSRAAILVRVQPDGSAVGLIVGSAHIEWALLGTDGKWENVVSGTLSDGYGEEGAKFRVEVRDNLYVAYVLREDHQPMEELGAFSDDGFPSGGIGFWLKSSTRLPADDWRAVPKIDNLVVTPLD